MGKKLTVEYVDEVLFRKNIQRMNGYTNSSTKMKFHCLVMDCGYEWETTLTSILYQKLKSKVGTGCKRCSKKECLTNKNVDIRIHNRNMTRVDDVIDTMTPIHWKCSIQSCGNVWKTTPDSILNVGTGCSKCARNVKLTNEILDFRLEGKNIIRLGNFISVSTPIKFQCLTETCRHVWVVPPTSILHNETGCPNCRTGKNERLVGKILKRLNIKYEFQKSIKDFNKNEKRNFKFDYYLPVYDTIIEYDGEQHFRPIMYGKNDRLAEDRYEYLKECDRHKNKFCSFNNIKLIRIDGRKYMNSKLEKYLTNEIAPEILSQKTNFDIVLEVSL